MEKIDREDIQVLVADAEHEVYVDTIIDTIREAARRRGTGIAERTHEYVATKMREGKAILALDGDKFVGFSYIETWGNKHYVTTSGGFIGQNDFGFSYVNALAQNFFEITEIHRYAAEGLDIFGTDEETVMQRAKIEIESDTQKL